jgi:hypothetical protein
MVLSKQTMYEYGANKILIHFSKCQYTVVKYWCGVLQITGPNTFQKTVNSEWYVSDILDHSRASKCVIKLVYMLQGTFKSRRGSILANHIK